MRYFIFLLLLGLSSQSLKAWATPACSPEILRVVQTTEDDLLEEEQTLIEVTGRRSGSVLSTVLPLGSSEPLSSPLSLYGFRKAVRESFSFALDALSIIQTQRNLFAEVHQSTLTHDRVLGGQIGRIRPMNCLEGLLMSRHLDRFTDIHVESEFRAQIYKQGRVTRILFSSNRRRDGLGPGTSYFARMRNSSELSGFELVQDIHSHPFRFRGRSRDPGGSIVPSGFFVVNSQGVEIAGGDLPTAENLARETAIRQMIVINGLEANVISRDQFSLYR